MKIIITSTNGQHMRPPFRLSRKDMRAGAVEVTVMAAFCTGMFFLACALH